MTSPRLLLAALLAFSPLAAADRNPEYAVSLGIRNGATIDETSSGGASPEADPAISFGLSAGWWVRPDGWFEVLFDRQVLAFDTFDMNVDFLQFAAGYEPPSEGVKPYVTVGFGLSRYGADPGSVSDSTGLSASIGGGFKVPMGRKALFRLEARGWAGITSSSAAVVCGEGCALGFGGSGWWQLAVRAAIAWCPKGRNERRGPIRDTP
jgi:hypothetical protein